MIRLWWRLWYWSRSALKRLVRPKDPDIGTWTYTIYKHPPCDILSEDLYSVCELHGSKQGDYGWTGPMVPLGDDVDELIKCLKWMIADVKRDKRLGLGS